MEKEAKIKDNPANDEPATIVSPSQYEIANQRRVDKETGGRHESALLGAKFDILLVVYFIVLILLSNYFGS